MVDSSQLSGIVRTISAHISALPNKLRVYAVRILAVDFQDMVSDVMKISWRDTSCDTPNLLPVGNYRYLCVNKQEDKNQFASPISINGAQ